MLGFNFKWYKVPFMIPHLIIAIIKEIRQERRDKRESGKRN